MRRAFLAAAALVWAVSAFAQDYPNRPIRIIVPTPAGGPVDVMARVLANALPAVLGQNVFIENKPGAGNTIGSRQAAAADPDGYTLMVSAASGLIMSPMIVKNAGYDASSFAPIALVAETPQVVVINPQLPFRSIAELVDLCEGQSGQAQLFNRRHRHAAPSQCGIVQVRERHKYPARTLQRRRAVAHGCGGRRGSADLRYREYFAATDPGWKTAGAGDRRTKARAGIARCAGHAGDRISSGNERRLDRTDGAARHTAGDHRQTQCRDKCCPPRRDDEKCPGEVGSAAARRHPAGARRSHRERTEEVDAHRGGVEFESGLKNFTCACSRFTTTRRVRAVSSHSP